MKGIQKDQKENFHEHGWKLQEKYSANMEQNGMR